MLISLPYFLLVGIFVIIYYTAFRKHQSVFACIMSIIMLGIYSPAGLVCVLTETLFAKELGSVIGQVQRKGLRRFLLIFSVIFFVTVTVLLKYVLPDNSHLSLFDTNNIFETSFVLGSSYFVLRFISYTTDVYYGKIIPEKSYFALLRYVTWFPALLQGPVERYGNFPSGKEFDIPFDYDNIRTAGILLLKGFFKTYVLAAYCGLFSVYINEPGEHGRGFLAFSVLMYSVQIYADFSGGVDIFRGISMLFGVKLPENFVRPYFASGFSEFWSRWHITFSSWLRDYIYIPLGGNRKGKARKYLNLVIVFIVSAVWHGISMPFLIWGLLHALYQIFEDIFRKKDKKKSEKKPLSIYVFDSVATFVFVAFAWIFFKTDSIDSVSNFFKVLFTGPSSHLWAEISEINTFGKMHILYLAMIIIYFVCEFVRDRYGFDIFEKSDSRARAVFRWIVYILMFAVILFAGFYGDVYDGANFIYGGF